MTSVHTSYAWEPTFGPNPHSNAVVWQMIPLGENDTLRTGRTTLTLLELDRRWVLVAMINIVPSLGQRMRLSPAIQLLN